LDALESWTRSLAGLTVSGAGLERTIAASLSSCPEAIRPQVTQLVARINARWTTTAALQAFADDLNDETADVLVMHLLRKAELRGSGLAASLE
ncbi:type II secretion system F family protein, partial [Klebsiella pneumoniae]